MSWLYDLYETYEENLDRVGKNERTRWGNEIMLLPEAHEYRNAQIEVMITPQGEFFRAEIVSKTDAPTPIPTTIKSANRTSDFAPHGLHDTLQYVAGDFQVFCKAYKKNKNPHKLYMDSLARWCQSAYALPAVISIKNYLEKGCLIQDLVTEQVLIAEENKLIPKWKKELGDEQLSIFSVLRGEQSTAMIRFTVYDTERPEKPPIWQDLDAMQAYTNFYKSELKDQRLDFITGKTDYLASQHPSKIRYPGDKAKIICSNDTDISVFRGRFSDKDQVATIGYESSQKGHNALKWLIAKQGFTLDGRVFLTWGRKVITVPSPIDSSYNLYDEWFAQDEESESLENSDTTAQKFAELFQKALLGYRQNMQQHEPVYILIMDAATSGRASILYYRSLNHELYFERLEEWHATCYWRHTYMSKKKLTFFGAPSLRDLAEAVHGSKTDEKIIKNTIEQLFACIVDNRPIPLTIVQSLRNRAANPASMEEDWEREKVLSIACAVMKKHYNYQKGEKTVSLNKQEKDRNYLFGRLLAVADVLEERALFQAGVKRSTAALRYMNAFSSHPLTTWKTIQESLIPYEVRLGDKGHYYQKLFDEIGTSFHEHDYSDQPLNGKFLLGYYSQRYELKQKSTIEQQTEE